jgi:ribosomal protein S6
VRQYKITFVVNSNTQEEIDKISEHIKNVLTSTGGTVERTDKMGRRRSGYEIARRWRHFAMYGGLAFCLVAAVILLPVQRDAAAQGQGNSLESRVSALESAVATLQTTVNTQNGQIAALQSKTQFMTVATDPITGLLDVYFTGTNIHILNGQGSTEGAPNGKGNLIIGYNELRRPGNPTVRTGSHNLIVGVGMNYSSYGGINAGFWNTISGPFASVFGGGENSATGLYNVVVGGGSNVAGGFGSNLVAGGVGNKAFGNLDVIAGGQHNVTNGGASVITGGFANQTFRLYSSVTGGSNNIAQADKSTVSGGSDITQSDVSGWSGGAFHTP